MKLTERQKKFVSNILSGMTQESAYASAYPKSASWERRVRESTASKVLHYDHVWSYYQEKKIALDAQVQEEIKEKAIWTKENSAEALKLVISAAVQDAKDAKERVKRGSVERVMSSQTANAIIRAVTALNELLNLNTQQEKDVTDEVCIIDDYGVK